jgi:4-alpha-glucanotransferase
MKFFERFTRSSGVLMPVMMLHGPFGIGVLGEEAYEFIDFLHRGGFRTWQVLPVEQTGDCFSPYRTISAYAGEAMMIDPRMLFEMGLVTQDELHERAEGTSDDYVNYELVRVKQRKLLQTAYSRLKGQPYSEFKPFWLNDYALYMAISQQYEFRPWHMWPEKALRAHEAEALRDFTKTHSDDINFYKFVQWLFDKQWSEMKTYAAERNVTIVGDMPIYVSCDSVEVWSRRDLFDTDIDGKYPAVGGVPPDVFSQDGQRWGDPVYNWGLIKKENYKWWIDRVRGSSERYDLVRIDHFRAFARYWSIPAESPTARKGKWVVGPGIELFEAMEKALGTLPVIAEDLGILGNDVYQLLSDTGFRGMRIMHFGFSENDDYHNPHSYTQYHVAYTGTHDNTTTLARMFEMSDDERERLLLYLGFEGDWTQGGPNSPIIKAWIRSLFTSSASLTVIPIQDLLGYGADTRTNTPGTVGDNWQFRIRCGALNEIDTEYYARLNKATFRTSSPTPPEDDTDGKTEDVYELTYEDEDEAEAEAEDVAAVNSDY